MESVPIALFGEAEKGVSSQPYHVKSLGELFYHLGEPPADTKGLFFAIQTILHGNELLYFRVESEGVTLQDYYSGIRQLKDPSFPISAIQALYMPGVGSKELLEEGFQVCQDRESLLIINESDFYDYLTD